MLNKSSPTSALKLMRTVSTAAFTKLQRMVLRKDPIGEARPEQMSKEQVRWSMPTQRQGDA